MINQIYLDIYNEMKVRHFLQKSQLHYYKIFLINLQLLQV